MEPEVEPAVAARLAAARSGQDVTRRLRIADLQPGDIGLLQAEVRALAPARTYARKRGGEGILQRLTLADESGEIDLVLWDDELQLARDGPLQPGAHVRLHGPLVKAGLRGGVELGLTGAEIATLPAPGDQEIEGILANIGLTRPVGNPPALRFTCDLEIRVGSESLRVVAWDQAVKGALGAGLGSKVAFRGRPNPFLDGWWTTETLRLVERNP